MEWKIPARETAAMPFSPWSALLMKMMWIAPDLTDPTPDIDKINSKAGGNRN